MTSHEDPLDERSGSATGAEPLDATEGPGSGPLGGLVEQRHDLYETLKSRPVIIAAVVAGATAAAVIGAKMAYDRRRSAKGYHRAVRQLEDAKDALIAATSEVPERSRAVVRRVMHR
ncbi:hypothetical protein [Glycomyces tarimensis]